MLKRLAAIFAFAFAVSGPASGAIIYGTGGAPADIPGLTGFMTTGGMMDGMSVTACFTVLGCETRSWADIIANVSGGVSGTGWGLSLSGDSFGGSWNFTTGPNNGQLLTLLLDGSTGLTVFDRSLPAPGTDGSANGIDWTSGLGATTTINVTFLNPVGIAGAPPVGDVYQMVLVDFGTTGPRIDFSFIQDTDNDSRFNQTPEPSSLALLGIGAIGFALSRRRRI